jgi:micrococcal nuclease
VPPRPLLSALLGLLGLPLAGCVELSGGPVEVPTEARGEVSAGWRVYDVVDGDTVKVVRDGERLTVRLIGIDTPETVKPNSPVECFGPESSRFADDELAGEWVSLEFDETQGQTDRYDRTLAYVWLERDGSPELFNALAVREGYAFEYTYDDAYAWQRELRAAEDAARDEEAGLWSPSTCDGEAYPLG